MMMGLKTILPFAAVLCLLLMSACSGGPETEKEEQLAKSPGQEIFLNHCMGCHMGAGDPPGPNDVILNSPKMASEDLFKKYIRQPDNGAMPAISESDVSDADVGKLYAYLKSAH